MSVLVEQLEDRPANNSEIVGWLEKQITSQRPTLLAFADDGVIWGRKIEGKLVTTHDIDRSVSPELNGETLQQAFVFGSSDEIHLFHDELGNWKAVLVAGGDDNILESHILWGDRVVGKSEKGFTHVKSDSKGVSDQIVPLEINVLGQDTCIRLDICHIVGYDELTGEAHIVLSRLAGLRVGQRNEVIR